MKHVDLGLFGEMLYSEKSLTSPCSTHERKWYVDYNIKWRSMKVLEENIELEIENYALEGRNHKGQVTWKHSGTKIYGFWKMLLAN